MLAPTDSIVPFLTIVIIHFRILFYLSHGHLAPIHRSWELPLHIKTKTPPTGPISEQTVFYQIASLNKDGNVTPTFGIGPIELSEDANKEIFDNSPFACSHPCALGGTKTWGINCVLCALSVYTKSHYPHSAGVADPAGCGKQVVKPRGSLCAWSLGGFYKGRMTLSSCEGIKDTKIISSWTKLLKACWSSSKRSSVASTAPTTIATY